MKNVKFVFLLLLVLVPNLNWAFDIQGHRGARWSRPENTLPAFEFAIEAGVNTLELDVVVTRDNEIVVNHDLILSRDLCLDPDGKELKSDIAIRSLAFKKLKTYDCASKRNPRFPDQTPLKDVRIPLLKDVFELAKRTKRKVAFNIETKIDPSKPDLSPSPEEFVRLIDGVIKKSGIEEKVILQSFDPRTLKAATQLELPYELSLLLESRPKPALEEVAKMFSAKIISPDFHWITAEDVRRLHTAGVKIIPWTVNDKADWRKMIDLGVDGIITDNPKGLVEFMKQTKTQPNQK